MTVHKRQQKKIFSALLKDFANTLNSYVSTPDGQWTIKGFIDIYKNIYTISSDTKIVSKILELHIFPKLVHFAEENGFSIELATCQNYYPDLTFISKKDPQILFAVDLKTTYRNPDNRELCNGFTLGSHGEYFINRNSSKNIQHPYAKYSGHFCLGIIYDRAGESTLSETEINHIENLSEIVSVIKNFQFFAEEKWKIASDEVGSGNTANIGSIKNIKDIINGNGTFAKLGEQMFDAYWMNFGSITIATQDGKKKKNNVSKRILAL